MTRWLRPFVVSMAVHGAVLGSGAWILGTHRDHTSSPSIYPVSLVFDPSIPAGTSGIAGPAGLSGPSPVRALPAPSVSPHAPVHELEQLAPLSPPMGISESTGTGAGGGGSGTGGGGGETGSGGGGGGSAGSSSYEPPRLLAGALPLDPDAGVAFKVPPEIPVRLRVGADGRVKDIVPEIENLAPAVMDALHRSADAMRFAPARSGGQAVEGWFSMTFVYRH